MAEFCYLVEFSAGGGGQQTKADTNTIQGTGQWWQGLWGERTGPSEWRTCQRWPHQKRSLFLKKWCLNGARKDWVRVIHLKRQGKYSTKREQQMRMLRGRKEREASLSFYFMSCIVMYMKALYHRGCDLLLQVSSHSLPRASELLFAASHQEPWRWGWKARVWTALIWNQHFERWLLST